MKRIFLLNFGLLLVIMARGQTNTAAGQEEAARSFWDERKATILYGIDEQILALIDTLQQEKANNLNTEILALLNTTLNVRLKEKIFAFFKAIDYRGAESSALALLENYRDEKKSLVLVCMDYIAVSKKDKVAAVLAQIMHADDEELARGAVAALAKTGNTEYITTLQEFLHDNTRGTDFKANVILALGALKDDTVVEDLITILEDEDQEEILRRFACDSLGKIQDERAIQPLKEVYGSGKTLLRSYAISALAQFQNQAVTNILMEALKDSYVQVRIAAAKGLGERKEEKAVPILLYKAERDPELKVKLAAIEALAAIGTSPAFDTLRQIYEDNGKIFALRVQALNGLVHHDLRESLPAIDLVIEREWHKPDSKILDITCKTLSQADSSLLKSRFSQFLRHPSINIKIYGIRGIVLNKFTDLKSEVEKLTDKNQSRAVRRQALSALEQL